jgi:hypothetical protein
MQLTYFNIFLSKKIEEWVLSLRFNEEWETKHVLVLLQLRTEKTEIIISGAAPFTLN